MYRIESVTAKTIRVVTLHDKSKTFTNEKILIYTHIQCRWPRCGYKI